MRASALVIALLAGTVVAGPAHAAGPEISGFTTVQGKNGYVAVTGRIVNGGAGVPGARVELTYVPKGAAGDSLYTPLVTDRQGRFALKRLLPHDGSWTAAYGTVKKKIVSNTKYVTGFSKPKAVKAGKKKVTVSGILVQYNGSPIQAGAWHRLNGKVTVWFRPKGKKKFKRQAVLHVKGPFKRTFAAGAGTWRLRYAGGADWLPSVSAGIPRTSK
ncbi:hypothetical protein GCM10027589_23940 [Actinocorallia lasiicapitis]